MSIFQKKQDSLTSEWVELVVALKTSEINTLKGLEQWND